MSVITCGCQALTEGGSYAGGWNMDPRLIPKAKELPFEIASALHPGDDRVRSPAPTATKTGQLYIVSPRLERMVIGGRCLAGFAARPYCECEH